MYLTWISEVRSIQQTHPHIKENTPCLFFDWSVGKVNVLLNDQDWQSEPTVYPNLHKLLDSLTEPHVIVGEASFESFNVFKRREVVERCASDGHLLLCTPTRQTVRHLVSMGFNKADKTDEMAVHVLRDYAKQGWSYLKRPSLADNPEVRAFGEIRKDANHDLMVLRASKANKIGKKGQVNKGMISGKDVWANQIIEFIPKYESLNPNMRASLGNGEEYSKTIVAAVSVCARYVTSREDFDRLAGLSVHGYGCQVRSDLYLHGFWRKLDKAKRANINLRKPLLRSYHRALRWLFQQVKVVSRQIPYPIEIPERRA
jgi:hypothetical protein